MRVEITGPWRTIYDIIAPQRAREAGHRTNACSTLPGCGSSTARSRAGALNRVKGMPFDWSLNPTGCAHRCTFCYVRAFEARADRPSDDRLQALDPGQGQRRRRPPPGACPRVVEAEAVAIGAATDPYQPAEGRYRLTRACIQELGAARTPFSLITRGPMIRRDVDVLAEAADAPGARQLLGADAGRAHLAGHGARHRPPRRLEAVAVLSEGGAGIDTGVALAPVLPGLSDDPELLADVVREARRRAASGVWANVLYLRPGTREHFLEALGRDWPELLPRVRAAVRRARLPPASETEPVRTTVRGLARTTRRPRRPPIAPAPEPEQLALVV